jgi:hypothetical protein
LQRIGREICRLQERLIERRRIGPVIRELERTTDPLLQQAGIPAGRERGPPLLQF